MYPAARAVCVGVSLAAMLTACSKPVSPVVEQDAVNAPDSTQGVSWSKGGKPQTSLARLRFVADQVMLSSDFRTQLQRNVEYLVDVDWPSRDTVPVHSVLKQVRWLIPSEHGNRYFVDNHPEYSLDAAQFAPPTTEGLPPGALILRLRVPERAGGGWITTWLHSNLAPVMWWAGPDPARFPPSSDGDGRAVDVLDWANFATSPAWPPDGRGYFGPDSFQYVPSVRLPVNGDIERRTFYEIWGDRIYARSEGDVVHQGAWLVFSTGGFDGDSPYVPRVSAGAPLPPGYESQPDLYPVLIEQGLIGSPIGFRHRVPVRLANGQLSFPSESVTHPNFDVFSVLYSPYVASYWPALVPGKAYAMVFPVDGHGQVGRTSEDLVALADRVDSGGGSDADRALRRLVLTFEVSGPGPISRSADDRARGR